MSEIDKLKFQKLEEQFSAEFEDHKNKQILFSGPFGSGKTTFLKDFAKNNPTSKFIEIYPVNYSLHTNTDIYELLKYDIILELITKGCFESEDIDKLVKYTYALSQTVEGAFQKIINLFSKTGKKLGEAAELLEKSHQKFSTIKIDLVDPLASVKEFEKKVGILKAYEYDDFITAIIKEKIISLGVNVVLVVDDLDTIDPEHLFRLISIFRAHIDHHSDENKFGFDKIIFVADVNNLRTMYAHRFGSGESFNGYISKLSSKNFFHFNPAKELYTKLNTFLSRIQITIQGAAGTLPLLQNSNDNVNKLALYLVANLINVNVMNLRDLVKENILNWQGDNYLDDYKSNLYQLEIYPVYTLLKRYVNNLVGLKSTFALMANSPVGLNQIFQGVRNYEFMYSNFSIPFLEVIAHLPEFKEKKENEVFALDVNGKLFNIRSFKQSLSRKLYFQIEEETISGRDFFEFASFCLLYFEEKTIDL